MGVRSDVIFDISFDKKYKDIVASHLKKLLLDSSIEDKSFNHILKQMYLSQDIDAIKFFYFEECIKYNFIEESINSIIGIIKEINNDIDNEDIEISYELLELCTEFLDLENSAKSNKNHNEYFVNAVISNIPTEHEDNINIIEWLKSN